ncbi:hypothetical protein JCM10450v2_003223 [Rhodotorula kratochvilovae]
MSGRLNDDVLRLILEELVAPACAHEAYAARQTTLRNVCLVSRRLRDLAQPLLWRQVWLRDQDGVDRVKAADDDGNLGSHTTILMIGPPSAPDVSMGRLVDVAHVVPNVEELRVNGLVFEHGIRRCTAMEMAPLERYTSLRRLSLAGVSCSRPAHLTSVEQLVLTDFSATSAVLEMWLHSTYLSRLLVLRLNNLGTPWNVGIDIGPLLRLCLSTLPPLDFVEVERMPGSPHGPILEPAAPPLLVNVAASAVFGSAISTYRHVILDDDPWARRQYGGDHEHGVLRLIKKDVAAAQTNNRLEILLLPRRIQFASGVDLALERRLVSFLAFCREKGIQVIWHDRGQRGKDELFSQEFWRYAKELKASRAAEEQ